MKKAGVVKRPRQYNEEIRKYPITDVYMLTVAINDNVDLLVLWRAVDNINLSFHYIHDR